MILRQDQNQMLRTVPGPDFQKISAENFHYKNDHFWWILGTFFALDRGPPFQGSIFRQLRTFLSPGLSWPLLASRKLMVAAKSPSNQHTRKQETSLRYFDPFAPPPRTNARRANTNASRAMTCLLEARFLCVLALLGFAAARLRNRLV